jgi:hypothetical protein
MSSGPSGPVSSGLSERASFETEVINDLSSKFAGVSDGLSRTSHKLSTFKGFFEQLIRKAWGHGQSDEEGRLL